MPRAPTWGWLSLALLIAACGPGTKSDRNRDTISGWVVLNGDEQALERSVAAAARYGVDQIQLSHDLIMNADDVLGTSPEAQERLVRLQRASDAADRLGIDTYFWAHEISGSDIMVCYDPDDPLWESRAQAYRDVFAQIPSMDGVVLMFGSADAPPWFTACTCAWCLENYPDANPLEAPPNEQRIQLITERIGQVITQELGKKLIGRTFVHEEAENNWHSQGFASVRDVDFLGMHKSEVQDWQPYNPPSPTMGQEGDRDSLMEMDVAGEYYGLSELPFCAPAYFAWRMNYMYDHRGIGSAVRIERGSHSALGTPNEINLLAITRRLEDPDYPLADIWQEFITEHYGLSPQSPEAAILTTILGDTFAVRLKSHYVLGIWALNKNSDLPTSTTLDQFDDRGYMPKFDPRWQGIWDSLDRPDGQVVIRVWQEGTEAVDLAQAGWEQLAQLEQSLAPEMYVDLHQRLLHQLLSTQAWRAVKLFIWAQRALLLHPQDSRLADWMGWAHEELARLRLEMTAQGLEQVELASPADIQLFLDNTEVLIPPEAVAQRPQPFEFRQVRLSQTGPGQARLSFEVSQAAQVELDWGLEIPEYGFNIKLGQLGPGQTHETIIDQLPPGQRIVVRIKAVTAQAEYLSGYHWLFSDVQ